jgi:hypothetical protein
MNWVGMFLVWQNVIENEDALVLALPTGNANA